MTYPRVSAILEAAGLGLDFAGVPEHTLEAARQRGSAVHEAISAIHYGYDFDVPPLIAPYVDGYLKFVADTGHEPLVSEFEVVSKRWRYQGHPDRLGWLAKHRMIADWKTGDQFDRVPVARQTSAYRLAYNEMHPEEPVALVVSVQFRSDGTYRLHEFTKDEMATATNEFLAAVVCYHARGRKA